MGPRMGNAGQVEGRGAKRKRRVARRSRPLYPEAGNRGVVMGFLRILSWILVGLAIALIGADGVSTLEAGTPQVRTTAEIVGLFGPEVGLLDGGGVAKVANFFLAAPLWALLGVAGIVLTLVFRPID